MEFIGLHGIVSEQYDEPSDFLSFCARGTKERKQPTEGEEREK